MIIRLHDGGRPPWPTSNQYSRCVDFPGSPQLAKFIGVRPEQLILGNDGLETVVKRVERLGDQTRLHLSLGDNSIVTVTDPHTDLKAGYSLSVKPRNPFFFDADGRRI